LSVAAVEVDGTPARPPAANDAGARQRTAARVADSAAVAGSRERGNKPCARANSNGTEVDDDDESLTIDTSYLSGLQCSGNILKGVHI
jgi:hypothetical protein